MNYIDLYIENFVQLLVSGNKPVTSDNDDQNNMNKRKYLFVEIVSNRKKLQVGFVFIPNRYTSIDHFMSDIKELTLSYTDLIIAGNFN